MEWGLRSGLLGAGECHHWGTGEEIDIGIRSFLRDSNEWGSSPRRLWKAFECETKGANGGRLGWEPSPFTKRSHFFFKKPLSGLNDVEDPTFEPLGTSLIVQREGWGLTPRAAGWTFGG